MASRITWTGMVGGTSSGVRSRRRKFLLPSHQENFGIAVAEALAAGAGPDLQQGEYLARNRGGRRRDRRRRHAGRHLQADAILCRVAAGDESQPCARPRAIVLSRDSKSRKQPRRCTRFWPVCHELISDDHLQYRKLVDMKLEHGPIKHVRLSTYRDVRPWGYLLKRALWSCVQVPFWPMMPPYTESVSHCFVTSPWSANRTQVLGSERCASGCPGTSRIDEFSVIANGAEIYNLAPICIGANSVVSQHTYLCTASHDYTKRDFPLYAQPITIGSSVWIAAGAFIDGINVGEGSVVGAFSVVVKDIPPWTVCAGNPCRVIKSREMKDNETGQKRALADLTGIEHRRNRRQLTGHLAQRPRFSVVTIALNDRLGFRETLASVEAQVFPDLSGSSLTAVRPTAPLNTAPS